MLRVINNRLNMLVTNRSNDLVWGALGANVVHFTYLHELIARATGYELGNYQVVTNNLHVYPGMPRYEEIRDGGLGGSSRNIVSQTPILSNGEAWLDLKNDCERAVFQILVGEELHITNYDTVWMTDVALPMMNAYLAGKNIGERLWWLDRVRDYWRMEGKSWVARRAS